MTLLFGFLSAETVEGIRPTVDEIGSLLTARTSDSAGDELGTFTGATRPTNLQVEELIDMAVADVASRIGADIPEAYWPDARRLAGLQAAALVESSFFPREISADSSAYRQYTAMYISAVERLTARVTFLGSLQGI